MAEPLLKEHQLKFLLFNTLYNFFLSCFFCFWLVVILAWCDIACIHQFFLINHVNCRLENTELVCRNARACLCKAGIFSWLSFYELAYCHSSLSSKVIYANGYVCVPILLYSVNVFFH